MPKSQKQQRNFNVDELRIGDSLYLESNGLRVSAPYRVVMTRRNKGRLSALGLERAERSMVRITFDLSHIYEKTSEGV
jgi:hypothetical protein